ncbi:MAG: helix-turn-helix transcriptional regulator [Lachnospiraceae bacterium]
MNKKIITIGDRIRASRKLMMLNQTELAKQLGKSLRTIQKYESGEIEVSISMLEKIADKLDTTLEYLIGYPLNQINIQQLSNVMEFIFQLNDVKGIDYSIHIKKPPLHEGWECSISFNGKDMSAFFNSDICLFLEEFKFHREEFNHYILTKEAFENWRIKTLSYYSNTLLEKKEEESLDEKTRIEKRNELLNKKN